MAYFQASGPALGSMARRAVSDRGWDLNYLYFRYIQARHHESTGVYSNRPISRFQVVRLRQMQYTMKIGPADFDGQQRLARSSRNPSRTCTGPHHSTRQLPPRAPPASNWPGRLYFFGRGFCYSQAAVQRAPQKTTDLPLAGPDQARSLHLSPRRSTAGRRDPRRRRTQHPASCYLRQEPPTAARPTGV
jgi:hypothetical protein